MGGLRFFWLDCASMAFGLLLVVQRKKNKFVFVLYSLI